MASTKYLRKIKAALSCSKDTKKELMKIIKNDIDAFLLEHPDATENDIINKFGSPDELAESYLASLDISEVNAQIKKAKKRKRIIVSICCIIVGLVLIFAIGLYNEIIGRLPSYTTEEIEEGETIYTHIDEAE